MNTFIAFELSPVSLGFMSISLLVFCTKKVDDFAFSEFKYIYILLAKVSNLFFALICLNFRLSCWRNSSNLARNDFLYTVCQKRLFRPGHNGLHHSEISQSKQDQLAGNVFLAHTVLGHLLDYSPSHQGHGLCLWLHEQPRTILGANDFENVSLMANL